MKKDDFAKILGFENYESLAGNSKTVFDEGDVSWFITHLPDGRWAAWDEAELSTDRVEYFDTYRSAIEFQNAGIKIIEGDKICL